jgi:hypothetical protein
MVGLVFWEKFLGHLQKQRRDLLKEVVVPRRIAQDPFAVDGYIKVSLKEEGKAGIFGGGRKL